MSSKKKKQRPRESIEEPGAGNEELSGGEASVIPAEGKTLPDEAELKRFLSNPARPHSRRSTKSAGALKNRRRPG
jgi:hypothetical protein